MKNRVNFIVMVLVVAVFSTFFQHRIGAATSIEVSLSLDPDHTLPGIPVGLRFSVTNNSDSTIIIPNFVLLQVTPKDGKTFLSQWGHKDEDSFVGYYASEDSKLLKIPAKQTNDFELPINPSLAQPECFYDYRLSFPGTYQMKLILDPDVDHSLLGHVYIDSDAKKKAFSLTEQIISNDVVLTVEEPRGEDALVWSRMLERTNGKGWSGNDWVSYGFSMAKEIWQNHKSSSYAPYIVAMMPAVDWDERIANYEIVLAANPNHLMAPFLHNSMANHYEDQMFYELNVTKNYAESRSLFQKRQQELKAVVEKTQDKELKDKAEEKLKHKWEGFYEGHLLLESRKSN